MSGCQRRGRRLLTGVALSCDVMMAADLTRVLNVTDSKVHVTRTLPQLKNQTSVPSQC